MTQQDVVEAPVERALLLVTPILVGGLAAALPLLLVSDDWSLFARLIVHLSSLTLVALVASVRVAPLAAAPWFTAASWSVHTRRVAGAVVLVVTVTGAVGLITLATSAAMRYQPSLQFLQLLSALDIAWVVAATTIGATLRWNSRAGAIAGAAIGVACVLSIWNYVRVVGFAADGGWLLDGSELLRLVIPGDVVAAIIAVVVLLAGLRSAD